MTKKWKVLLVIGFVYLLAKILQFHSPIDSRSVCGNIPCHSAGHSNDRRIHVLSTIPHGNFSEGDLAKGENDVGLEVALSKRYSNRYLITMYPLEQLTAQSSSYVKSCHIASTWNNSHLVEPFVCQSGIYGIKDLKDGRFCKKNHVMIPYGDIYQVSELNKTIACNGCTFRSWTDFVINSYRKIILVSPLKKTQNKILLQDVKGDNILKAMTTSTTLSMAIKQLNAEAKKYSVSSFQGVGVIQWNTTYSTSVKDLIKMASTLTNHSNDYTIFFLRYRATHYIFKQEEPAWHLGGRNCTVHLPVVSKGIEKLSQQFLQSLNIKADAYVAIHVSHARECITCLI